MVFDLIRLAALLRASSRAETSHTPWVLCDPEMALPLSMCKHIVIFNSYISNISSSGGGSNSNESLSKKAHVLLYFKS